MDRNQKIALIKIIIAAIIFAIALLFFREGLPQIVLFMLAYLIVGYITLFQAVKSVFHMQVLDENFLMSIASLGAIVLGEYPEAIAVMLFYHVGAWFESFAVGKSRDSIAALMDIRPDYANQLVDGIEKRVDPETVMPGDIILIKPGEKVPLDGKIATGASSVDTSALTGESMPSDLNPGDDIISGCVNLTGVLTVEVSKEFGESAVSKILELVEHASSKKANVENFITKFARYYTPIVVIVALLLAIVPPLVISAATFSDWGYRALVFLVVSCPCALVVSVPLSFFGGIGGASRCGILVKGSNYLEALSKAETIVFDKTGTLTKGVFEVSDIVCVGDVAKDRLIELAAYAENYSSHPISQSIKKAYGKPIDASTIGEIKEIAGHGVEAHLDDLIVHAGNLKLMKQISLNEKDREKAERADSSATDTTVHIAINRTYAGYISIADQIKSDSKKAISDLKNMGIRETVMLTGDKDAIGQKIASELGLDKAYTELLPADKVAQIEMLLTEKSAKGMLVFVGDGINDAPVLARADVGVAMGTLGADAAIEAADIVIMTDEPSKLATVIKISKKTVLIAKQNIVFALGVKGIVLSLGALGIATMWGAVIADVGVAFIAILNSMRTLKSKALS